MQEGFARTNSKEPDNIRIAPRGNWNVRVQGIFQTAARAAMAPEEMPDEPAEPGVSPQQEEDEDMRGNIYRFPQVLRRRDAPVVRDDRCLIAEYSGGDPMSPSGRRPFLIRMSWRAKQSRRMTRPWTRTWQQPATTWISILRAASFLTFTEVD